MTEFFTALTTAIATFTATNLDDILILTLFFSRVNALFCRRQIIMGQYLGFILLVLVSLAGFFGSFVMPSYLIRGLGLIPLILGLIALNDSDSNQSESLEERLPQNNDSHGLKTYLSPQVYSVAAITVANGSDNISVYVPLFAHSSGLTLSITLITFLFLVAVWCVVAYRLTHLPAIADLLTRYGNRFVPCVLIALGVYLVKESLLLGSFSLIISFIWTIILNPASLSPED